MLTICIIPHDISCFPPPPSPTPPLWHIKFPSICFPCQNLSVPLSSICVYSHLKPLILCSFPRCYTVRLIPHVLNPSKTVLFTSPTSLQPSLSLFHLFSPLSEPILSFFHQLRGTEACCAKCHSISLFLAAAVIAWTFPLFLLPLMLSLSLL